MFPCSVGFLLSIYLFIYLFIYLLALFNVDYKTLATYALIKIDYPQPLS